MVLFIGVGTIAGAVSLYGEEYFSFQGWAFGGAIGMYLGGAVYFFANWLFFGPSRTEMRGYELFRAARDEWVREGWALKVEEKRRGAARDAADRQRKRGQKEYWLRLSGHEFEQELGDILRRHPAYSDVLVTPGSSDGGIDVYAKRSGEKLAIQCKNYSKPIGPRPVRELKGVLRRGEQGVLVASSGLTQSAAAEARRRRIEIWDVDAVLRLAAGAGAGN